jgi:hypothetical protein
LPAGSLAPIGSGSEMADDIVRTGLIVQHTDGPRNADTVIPYFST